MMTKSTAEIDQMFEDDGSLAMSLESFDPERLDPNQSDRDMDDGESGAESEAESDHSSTPWSPPAWRKGVSGWQQRHNLPPPDASITSKSRSASPTYRSTNDEGDDTLLPANVPLPASPEKQTPMRSVDPTPDVYPRESDFSPTFGAGRGASKEVASREVSVQPETSNNFIRFAVRAEVQHRTEPFEAAFEWFRSKMDFMTGSYRGFFSTVSVMLAAYIFGQVLLSTPRPLPAPDILKATQVARTFEPLIYYSEIGNRQVSELQDTGVAVWDLGESIRSANMSTGTQGLSEQLEELSETINHLVPEMTKFFVNVDADIDSILLVMEWAKRKLATVEDLPAGSISTALDNFQTLLNKVGVLEQDGKMTSLGRGVRFLFGDTILQRNSATLQQTFNHFLNVLEESINNELQHSLILFTLFEKIDRQFLNLQRTVVRESDQQEVEEDQLLGSLWTRIMGAQSNTLRKYQKNKNLLASVRQRTILNKHIIKDHNSKLLQMKTNLDILRRKLASQLLRTQDPCVLPMSEQIQGLDETYVYLKSVREKQKQKTMEQLSTGGYRKWKAPEELPGAQ